MPARGNVSHDKKIDKKTVQSADAVKTTNTMCEASMLLDEKNKLKLITELLQQLNLAGLQREHEVCMAVQRVHITDLKFCSAWNTCNLTGEMCADSLHFLCDGVSYNIHKRFAYFVNCLWTCTHIAKLRQELASEVCVAQVAQGAQEAQEAQEAQKAPEAQEAPEEQEAQGAQGDASGNSVGVQEPTHATHHAYEKLNTAFHVAYAHVCDVLRGTLLDTI